MTKVLRSEGAGSQIRTDDLLITNPTDAIPVSASNSRSSDSVSMARCETRLSRNGLETTSKIQISLVSIAAWKFSYGQMRTQRFQRSFTARVRDIDAEARDLHATEQLQKKCC